MEKHLEPIREERKMKISMEVFEDFVILRDYLQEELDKIQVGFKVSKERILKSYFEGEVVITQLVGTVNKYNAVISYQIDVITSDIENAMNVFTQFAKSHNKVAFDTTIDTGEIDELGNKIYIAYNINQSWNTPTVMEKDIGVGSNHFARITMFGNLFILFNSSNVKQITIDGENIDFVNGSLVWQQTMRSDRKSGQANNKNISEASAVSLSFQFASQQGIFANKLSALRTGAIHRTTAFAVKVVLTNDVEENYTMLLGTATLTFAITATPNYQIIMSERQEGQ